MKTVTADWLRSARVDLETIDAILGNSNLTAVVAFMPSSVSKNV
jgi:hypothetical protein